MHEETEQMNARYFKKTFDKLGFKKYETSNTPGRGSLIKFKNETFRIQLINDRGLIDTEISPLFGDEQFRNIEFYNSLLMLMESSPNPGELEKQKILHTRMDYQSQAIFLLNNYNKLKTLLDKENYQGTLNAIDNIG
jgi:hypothetical protein